MNEPFPITPYEAAALRDNRKVTLIRALDPQPPKRWTRVIGDSILLPITPGTYADITIPEPGEVIGLHTWASSRLFPITRKPVHATAIENDIMLRDAKRIWDAANPSHHWDSNPWVQVTTGVQCND